MTDFSEKFENALFHAEPKRKYDPIKRREYYLRTRELKGRKKSSKVTRVDRNTGKVTVTNDPIGDVLNSVGNSLSNLKKRAAEGVKDAKLTYEVIRLESAARKIAKDSKNEDFVTRAKAGAAIVKIMFEIEKKKREIAKSSVSHTAIDTKVKK